MKNDTLKLETPPRRSIINDRNSLGDFSSFLRRLIQFVSNNSLELLANEQRFPHAFKNIKQIEHVILFIFIFTFLYIILFNKVVRKDQELFLSRDGWNNRCLCLFSLSSYRPAGH